MILFFRSFCPKFNNRIAVILVPFGLPEGSNAKKWDSTIGVRSREGFAGAVFGKAEMPPALALGELLVIYLRVKSQ